MRIYFYAQVTGCGVAWHGMAWHGIEWMGVQCTDGIRSEENHAEWS